MYSIAAALLLFATSSGECRTATPEEMDMAIKHCRIPEMQGRLQNDVIKLLASRINELEKRVAELEAKAPPDHRPRSGR